MDAFFKKKKRNGPYRDGTEDISLELSIKGQIRDRLQREK
jgi:DNA-dependent RNA polymerase auxiliary subunit epsilon